MNKTKITVDEWQQALLDAEKKPTVDGYLDMWEIAKKLGVSHDRAGDLVRLAVRKKTVNVLRKPRSITKINGQPGIITVYRFEKVK
jgi:hypothetical protein